MSMRRGVKTVKAKINPVFAVVLNIYKLYNLYWNVFIVYSGMCIYKWIFITVPTVSPVT